MTRHYTVEELELEARTFYMLGRYEHAAMLRQCAAALHVIEAYRSWLRAHPVVFGTTTYIATDQLDRLCAEHGL